MPVDSNHTDYDARVKEWTRCRDCIEGSDAVKAKGGIYLPQLGGQNTEEYTAYKERTLFFGGSSRTLQGLMGTIFRKDPTYEIETRYEGLVEKFTKHGLSLHEFSRRITREVISVGRVGVLTDLSPDANAATGFGYDDGILVASGTFFPNFAFN